MDKNLPDHWTASADVEIPFHDVDMMEVAWHGHYAKYFELARCKLFDQIAYNYPQMRDSGYAWPVIDLQVRYIQPLRFQQKVTVTAWIDEWENRLRLQYRITDSASGMRLTKGRTDQVAVNMKTGELCLVTPAILREKLGLTHEESMNEGK